MSDPIDRREFFSQLWQSTLQIIKDYPLGERPPGAHSDDHIFKEKCTGCDACMIACPVNVIMIEDVEKRYPVIYPDQDPCIRCEDTPCIKACTTGALTLI